MNTLSEIPWGLIAPLLVLQGILIMIALINLVRIPATNGPKWVWALIIVMGNLLGPILYFILGRKSE